MVNIRTLRGLRAALLECVPGRAQRTKLLEALARVPGNRHVSAVMAWMVRAEEESKPQKKRPPQTSPPPPGINAKLVSYTRSSPEVIITLDAEAAQVLLETVTSSQYAETPVLRLLGAALRSVLPKKDADLRAA